MHNAQGKGGLYPCFSARDGIRKFKSDPLGLIWTNLMPYESDPDSIFYNWKTK